MVAITEYVPDEEDQEEAKDGELTGKHKEVTHVQVQGDGVSKLFISTNIVIYLLVRCIIRSKCCPDWSLLSLTTRTNGK